MIFLDYSHRENDFESFVKSQENPIVVFEVEDNILFPALLIASKRGIRRLRLQQEKLILSQTKLLKLKAEYEKSKATLYWAAGVRNLTLLR